jgi:membrane-bound PQQ-dependent dehydrogenase (glucose/quinate/shikimate family)
LPGATALALPDPAQGEWREWGRTLSGTRFAPISQIDTRNVKNLQLVWRFDSDVPKFGFHSFEATPLAVGGKLYVCLDRDVIVALNQETGAQLWRFDPHSNLEGVFAATCRGVAYYEAPQSTNECAKRILFGRSFGTDGAVDLKNGLGDAPAGIAFPTSPPTIVNGTAIIGGWVTDGLYVGEPSGVVRGYDAITGALRWAWDSGRPQADKPLAPGETYTRGAPNAWGVYSGDETLNLVYLGMGVSTPDYVGSHRTAEAEKYSNAIVALDASNGHPRWSFQTVHHDLWDYDVGAQPVVVELPVAARVAPALIAPTKRGQFFILDRLDGHPIYPLDERPVPQGAAEGDWTAPTQPYSGFSNVAAEALSEKHMWGVTPLDQLWCRLTFKRARYDGEFTPPAVGRDAIFFPGSAGGVNWGSVAIDTERNILVVNSLIMPDIGRLIPRADVKDMKAGNAAGHTNAFLFPQEGTPYAIARSVFLNPLLVPCAEPPYGKLTAIDLKTGTVIWSKPLGTALRAGPLEIESLLPLSMGAPNLGGSIATSGGLVFVAAAQDRFLRAFDIGNGEELWRYSLPSVAAATPMTFVSRESGRQFLVIASGGHPALPGPLGGSILAFALPAKP